MKRLLLIPAVVFSLSLEAQPRDRQEIDLFELMTPREYAGTGVRDLPPRKRRRLELWLQEYIQFRVDEAVSRSREDAPIFDTYRIAAVDKDGHTVTLDDGSVWAISTFDRSQVRRWLPSHRIEIKRSTGFTYPYELVNQTVNQTASAKLQKAGTEYLEPINEPETP